MRLKDEKFYKTVRDFLDIYLIKHRGYSLNTQKSYREAINLLLLYFKTELGLEYQHPTKEKQEKEPGTKHPGSTHFCPQCGQFPAF